MEIGDVFLINGKKYKTYPEGKNNGCEGCYFDEMYDDLEDKKDHPCRNNQQYLENCSRNNFIYKELSIKKFKKKKLIL